MEDLELIKRALEKANNQGAFTLDEASLVLTAYVRVKNYLASLNGEQKRPETKDTQEEPKAKSSKAKTK